MSGSMVFLFHPSYGSYFHPRWETCGSQGPALWSFGIVTTLDSFLRLKHFQDLTSFEPPHPDAHASPGHLRAAGGDLSGKRKMREEDGTLPETDGKTIWKDGWLEVGRLVFFWSSPFFKWDMLALRSAIWSPKLVKKGLKAFIFKFWIHCSSECFLKMVWVEWVDFTAVAVRCTLRYKRIWVWYAGLKVSITTFAEMNVFWFKVWTEKW